VATAQAGVRTLVVDANLRTPHQHAICGLVNDKGLATARATPRPSRCQRASPTCSQPGDTGYPIGVARRDAARRSVGLRAEQAGYSCLMRRRSGRSPTRRAGDESRWGGVDSAGRRDPASRRSRHGNCWSGRRSGPGGA
jgi:hypothetical protein